jgi:hypothetical protein
MSQVYPPPTQFQPTLPPEGSFTEAEKIFMDESPPGLFPENQDSNFGFIIRKLFSDFIQDQVNWVTTLWSERFIESSELFLDQWEIDYGLPVSTALIEQRRAAILSRVQRGPFTRPRRDDIIRRYVETTFGTPISLTLDGVELVSAGVPIYGESGDVEALFDVIENIPGFSYVVWIASTNTPDLVALTRELKRITPAGISFTITSVHP